MHGGRVLAYSTEDVESETERYGFRVLWLLDSKTKPTCIFQTLENKFVLGLGFRTLGWGISGVVLLNIGGPLSDSGTPIKS